MILKGFKFQSPKVRKENSKNCQISIFGFQCVAKNIEGKLDTCIWYLVYSQIWLQHPQEDVHFSYIFLWAITT
jgi:hypothetical protein